MRIAVFFIYGFMNAELIKISKLKTNSGQIGGLPANPRFIKDDKYKKLLKSLQDDPEMLELRELIVYPLKDDYIVIGGNMRLRAMQELGFKDASCKVLDPATPAEKLRAYTMKDNIGYGENDWDLLANEWDSEQLQDWGLDIPGFEPPVELEAEEDNYEIPDIIETDIVLGDLFEIGEHRLLCGDSTDSYAVARLMNGQKADMVFTDPPYEIDFDYANTLLYSENCHVFVFNNDRSLIRQLQNSPLEFKKFFVFHHSGTAIPQEGGNEIFLDHVLVSHEVNGKPKVRYNKGNGTRSVIKGEYRRAEEHKHQKPFSFLSPIVEGYTNTGFIVLDFFAGGGSLFVVSHQLKRKCYGIELDPKYCQVIIDRMLKLDSTLTVKRNGEPYTKQ